MASLCKAKYHRKVERTLVDTPGLIKIIDQMRSIVKLEAFSLVIIAQCKVDRQHGRLCADA
jgi:hypothetical protein